MDERQGTADYTVIGTGPAGLTTALALSQLGVTGIATGPRPTCNPDRIDTRTTAIFNGGIALLQRLGVWQCCASAAAPLAAIRIIDDTGRLFRAPETLFEAREVGAETFGYNVPNAALVSALFKAIEANDAVSYVETSAVSSIRPYTDFVELTLANGRVICVKVVAGADGRRSIARAAAQIEPFSWDYDQAAIVCSFAHSRSHDNISTEFHRPSGPLTTVPLPGKASSLVWVENKTRAKALARLGDEEFTMELERRLGGLLGDVSAPSRRAHFPLSGMAAKHLAANRIALIGEAAHVVPPIGAQGLNLGFRDGAALADCIADAVSAGRDPGGPQTLAAYRQARRVDVLSRTAAIDLLNRTLLSNLLPAQLVRGAGLHALNALPLLKRFVMREGIQPGQPLPRLMQPFAP